LPALRRRWSAAPSCRVHVQVAVGLVHHALAERAVARALVHRRAHVAEQAGVVAPRAARVAQTAVHGVHGGGEEAHLRQRPERVQPHVAPRRRPQLVRVVGGAALLARELHQPVEGPLHVLVAVHLEQVAEAQVHQQPADGEVLVHHQRTEALGVAPRHQLLDGQLHQQRPQLAPVVVRQRVVHVEAHHLDAVEAQVAVAEHAPLEGRRPNGRGQQVQLRQGERELSREGVRARVGRGRHAGGRVPAGASSSGRAVAPAR
jgi:hypothetical protein